MVRIERGPSSSGTKPPARGPLPSRCGSTQNLAAQLKVVVRVRPLNEKEKQQNNRIVVDVVDDRMLVFDPKEEARPFFYQGVQQPNKCFLKRANKEMKFVFDHVCDMNASNEVVFETATKDMLASLMEGYNCSVFVYGATGAGKTFTMIGSSENPGITYLTMDHLFYTMTELENDREFDIAVSYIEVYNENVYDLLKPSSTPLQLREDSKYGVMVAGLTLNSIKTARELLNMLENGNKKRTQHPTDANAESSRSHAVFQVYLKMRYKTTGQLRIVKLSMIDLAGSERASATGCVGDRFKEGANINKSLLSLGNCINKLADGSNYIPYRDSKLTRLLKDSLGGNCKTVMIANISPSSTCYEDTYNTLKYAERASKIKLTIKKNIVDGDMRVSQYVKIIEELKKKIKELEAKLSLNEPRVVKVAKDDKLDKAKDEWRRRILEAEASLSAAESALLSLMCSARVVALRRRLRTRAATHFAELAHRSSAEGMEQRCTEDIPRDERSAEYYKKKASEIDAEVHAARSRWEKCRKNLHVTLDRALTEHSDLADFAKIVHQNSEIRILTARDELRNKLLTIENAEISLLAEYVSCMPSLLKKLYLTIKGYGMAPPSLTEEYLQVMKKSKTKVITWADKNSDGDAYFKTISSLDLNKPHLTDEFSPKANLTIDLNESEDLTDTEHVANTSAKKRKGTPIKLTSNETILINDSLEFLDTTRTLNSAKKLKLEFEQAPVEIDPKDLNSTFVMAGKVEPIKSEQKIKTEKENVPVRRVLTDGTNLNREQKNVHFADRGRVVKPLGKALPVRRPGAPHPAPPAPRSAPGFGSSLSRDGTRLDRNVHSAQERNNATQKSVGFKAMRPRDRSQNHPYSRPAPHTRR